MMAKMATQKGAVQPGCALFLRRVDRCAMVENDKERLIRARAIKPAIVHRYAPDLRLLFSFEYNIGIDRLIIDRGKRHLQS